MDNPQKDPLAEFGSAARGCSCSLLVLAGSIGLLIALSMPLVMPIIVAGILIAVVILVLDSFG